MSGGIYLVPPIFLLLFSNYEVFGAVASTLMVAILAMLTLLY
jgi:hypothetical protein